MFGFAIIYEPRAGFWGVCGHFTVYRVGDRFLGEVLR